MLSVCETGHGDRYIGSLFRVDEPVPDDSVPDEPVPDDSEVNPSNFCGSLQYLSLRFTQHEKI